MWFWDVDQDPFACAMEIPSRRAEREILFELIVHTYPAHMLKGVAATW
jgi:hypothetical protein